jgi:predicted metal-dependent phosphoesterase TrpH
MARFDLHCHSTRSDGLLTPAGIVVRAALRGVDVLALTDHDEVGGCAEAGAAASEAGLTLIAGTEISAGWEDTTIHVIGLGIDPTGCALVDGLANARAGRVARARRIADSLAEAGIPGAWEGARSLAPSASSISRVHFARFLVAAGHARDTGSVFRRFLVRGRPGYVAHAWASLDTAIGWIRGAGGIAVLAHPGRYRLGRSGMRRLLGAFRDAGGAAIEVLSPAHTAAQTSEFATHARVFGLLASTGSDYHGPGEGRVDLGGLPDLPGGVAPVWSQW